MICATLVEPTVEGVVAAANTTDADLVEVRLDYLKDHSRLSELTEVEKPIIISCPPKTEGGVFAGLEEERIAVLLNALPPAEYVTVEMRMQETERKKLIEEAGNHGTKVIVSFHDFDKPLPLEELSAIVDEQRALGADIAKVACTAKTADDAVTMLRLLRVKRGEGPIIAIAMGDQGALTRSLGPALGAYLTYAAVDDAHVAAPGQLTVTSMKTMLEVLAR